jgi:hypothetical protein
MPLKSFIIVIMHTYFFFCIYKMHVFQFLGSNILKWFCTDILFYNKKLKWHLKKIYILLCCYN